MVKKPASSRRRTISRRSAGALAGAALTALVAAGCASGSSSATSSGSATLTVWSFQGESANPSAGVPYAFYLIDRAFEKAHPGIKVQMVLQPFANYRPLFATAAQSQSGPDVWEALPGSYVFQYKSVLQPLNQYITPAFKKSLRGWSGATVPEWSNSGTIYGIPSALQSYVWYYNKALFAKAGISTPPATWPEFIADAQKLKAAGITPLANGLKDGFGIDQYLNPMLAAMLPPKQILGLGDGSLSWASAVPERAATMFRSLAPYFESGYPGVDFEGQGIDLFSGGKTAMIPGLISNNENYFQFEAALGKGNVGVFRTPSITSAYSKQLTFTSDYMWTITKWAKNTSAAVQYAKFMVSPQAQQILLKDGGDIPNLVSVPDSEFGDANAAQIWQLLKSSTLTNQPNSNFSDALETAWHQQFQDVMAGSETVAQASKNMQAAASSGGGQ